jgi:hypothetical protein
MSFTVLGGVATGSRPGYRAVLFQFKGVSPKRIRYRLPYVARNPMLLHQEGFGDAVRTNLRGLGHMFGGDSSTSFSHALAEMLSATVRQAAEIGDWQRAWTRVGEDD